jgi:hypothetical protein
MMKRVREKNPRKTNKIKDFAPDTRPWSALFRGLGPKALIGPGPGGGSIPSGSGPDKSSGGNPGGSDNPSGGGTSPLGPQSDSPTSAPLQAPAIVRATELPAYVKQTVAGELVEVEEYTAPKWFILIDFVAD